MVGEELAQVVHGGGCPIPGDSQGQDGQGYEQSDRAVGVPVHCQKSWTRWLLRVPSKSNDSESMVLCHPPCCTPGYTRCHTPRHRQGHTWGCTPSHSHAAQTLYSSCKCAGIISPHRVTGPHVNTSTGQVCTTSSHP